MWKNNKHGYSLVEFTIVLALIIIIATLSMHSFNLFDHVTTRTTLHHMCMVCKYMQRTAITTKKTQTIFIDEKKQRYAFDNKTIPLPHFVKFGHLNKVKGPPGSPSKPVTKNITFKNNQIQCFPNGAIQSGTIYLTNKEKTCQYALSSSISPASRLRIYTWHNNSWHLIT